LIGAGQHREGVFLADPVKTGNGFQHLQTSYVGNWVMTV